MHTKKKIPFGTKIRRIQADNELTGKKILTLYLLREYGDKKLTSTKDAPVNFWTTAVVESNSFQKNLQEKNILNVGFPKADFETVEEVVKFFELENEARVQKLLAAQEEIDNAVVKLSFEYHNQTRKIYKLGLEAIAELVALEEPIDFAPI